jgi:AbrB family looped-hinge helix DNA binding protein
VVIGNHGELFIPAELRKAMGIQTGTSIAVLREGNRIILEPINKEYVRSLRGSTAGGPSMTDELLKERREEEASSKW